MKRLDAQRDRLLDFNYIPIGSTHTASLGLPLDPALRRSLVLNEIDGGAVVGFKVGQKVVYPNHGIGTIEQIEQKQNPKLP